MEIKYKVLQTVVKDTLLLELGKKKKLGRTDCVASVWDAELKSYELDYLGIW